MNVVVAGGGEVGLRIAELLMAQHTVVYVGATDRDRARLDRLEIDVVDGQLATPGTLEAAGVAKADVFLATSLDDEKNIVACVAARRLGAQRVVCFLNRSGFFAAAPDDAALAESLGIDAVVRPAGQLADEIVNIVTVPGALDVRSFVGGKVQLQKFELDPACPLVGQSLRDISLPAGVLAAMGQRDSGFFIPRGDTVFSPGERVTMLGTPRGLRRVRTFFADARGRGSRGKALVIGGGLVGSAVAAGLIDAGWTVRVVEADRARCSDLAAQLDCLVLHGDGSDLDLLEQEMADQPDALVAVTSNDEKNLLISLLGQHLGVPRVITRADRLINERIFEKVGVDVVLSAKGAAIRRVVNEFVELDGRHLAELEHGDFSVLDVALPTTFSASRVADLQLPSFAIIGAIVRGTEARVPMGKDTVEPGDHLIVVCDRSGEDELYRRLGVPLPASAAT
ncbi:MAG: Trk system potassium transporter TrkA [Myxococcales bacterium]|nr:Trk system potassium transporter TrkA [Myxococcales bacterium]MCB9521339.1 Trk system potassium transporter TrkA [Myxococcales bacterium]